MVSENEISFDAFNKICQLLYWSRNEQKKTIPSFNIDQVNEERERASNFIDSIFARDEYFKLKELSENILLAPLRLLPKRFTYFHNKLGSIPIKKVNRIYLKLLIDQLKDLEQNILDSLDLMNRFSECNNEADLLKMLEEVSDES